MTNPCPGYPITTPYWKAGSAWGCGYHDGVDYAAPEGTDVVAAWSGTVTEAAYPTSFGSAFGRAVVIDHDKLPDGSPGGWGLYAHLSAEQVSKGQRVTAGQKIGDVGTTGNSSGNHLHFGIYMTDHWTSCGGKNPQPWIDAGTTDEGGSVSGGEYWYSGKPSGSLTFDDSYKRLDVDKWAPDRDCYLIGMLYANIDGGGEIRVRLVRDPDDATAYQTYYLQGGDNFLLTHVWFEKAEANRKLWWEFQSMDGTAHTIGTRYAKFMMLD